MKVIDTPDFFHDCLRCKPNVMECRELCEGGQCVHLLIQIGRLTEGGERHSRVVRGSTAEQHNGQSHHPIHT